MEARLPEIAAENFRDGPARWSPWSGFHTPEVHSPMQFPRNCVFLGAGNLGSLTGKSDDTTCVTHLATDRMAYKQSAAGTNSKFSSRGCSP